MNESISDFMSRLASGGSQVGEVDALSFVLLLVMSLVASVFISYLYVYFYSSRFSGSRIHLSFPLLGMSITAIFLCLQFSLPLSLGLLGALSIVRFRTPIKEPEEIGFLMLLIATSLACATANMLAVVGVLAVAVLALLVRQKAPRLIHGSTRDGSLVLSLDEAQYREHSVALFDYLRTGLRRGELDSISKNEGEIVVTYLFKSMPEAGLAGVEGELRRIVEARHLTILFNRPGAL